MRTATEPVVVTVHPGSAVPRSAFLADVLVVIADQTPPDGWPTGLFRVYSGLALVLTVGQRGEVVARSRDGMTLSLCIDEAGDSWEDWIDAAAQHLYFYWAAGLFGYPAGIR